MDEPKVVECHRVLKDNGSMYLHAMVSKPPLKSFDGQNFSRSCLMKLFGKKHPLIRKGKD